MLSRVYIPNKSIRQGIYLGRKYDVADWIRDSYVELVKKDKLTLEELSDGPFALDGDTMAKLFYIRDIQRPTNRNIVFHDACKMEHTRGSCSYGFGMPEIGVYMMGDQTAKDAVDKIFQEELKDKTKYTA